MSWTDSNMDETDSAATWAFIHQQQSLWSGDKDKTKSNSPQTFPPRSMYTGTGLTSPDAAFTSPLLSLSSNFPSPSTTLTSSGSSFISDSSDYRTNSASMTSQDSGFDEIDSGFGLRRYMDQDYTSTALGRNDGGFDSGTTEFYDDLSNSGEATVVEMSDFSLSDCHLMRTEELAFLLKAGLEKVGWLVLQNLELIRRSCLKRTLFKNYRISIC